MVVNEMVVLSHKYLYIGCTFVQSSEPIFTSLLFVSDGQLNPHSPMMNQTDPAAGVTHLPYLC